jgi:hypothetical protein
VSSNLLSQLFPYHASISHSLTLKMPSEMTQWNQQLLIASIAARVTQGDVDRLPFPAALHLNRSIRGPAGVFWWRGKRYQCVPRICSAAA